MYSPNGLFHGGEKDDQPSNLEILPKFSNLPSRKTANIHGSCIPSPAAQVTTYASRFEEQLGSAELGTTALRADSVGTFLFKGTTNNGFVQKWGLPSKDCIFEWG